LHALTPQAFALSLPAALPISLGLSITFHVLRRDAGLFQLLHDGIRYGLDVARRGPAANQKKVGKGADTFQVQKVQVHGFAVLGGDRKSTRLNSSHEWISYAVF